MRKYLFTLLCLLTLTVSAQNARQILDRTAAGLSGCVTASFTTSGAAGKASGTITVQGNKFYLASSQAKIWYDGKSQWALLNGSDEVNLTTPTAAEAAAMNPATFIGFYKKGYTMSTKTVGSNYQVYLKAQNPRASIKEAYVTVSRNGYVLKSVRLKQGKGWNTINVTSLKKSGKKPAAYFQFKRKDHPRVEVIDLR